MSDARMTADQGADAAEKLAERFLAVAEEAGLGANNALVVIVAGVAVATSAAFATGNGKAAALATITRFAASILEEL